MSFTDDSLATFMATQLGATGRALGLTAASDEMVSAVAWTASILGGPIASQADDLKTMTVATWRAWVAAKAASANDKNLKAGTTAIELAQRFEHIESMLADAERAARRYSDVAVIIGGGVPIAVPFAGGISRTDKAVRESNTDRVAPFFRRRLHEPVGTGGGGD